MNTQQLQTKVIEWAAVKNVDGDYSISSTGYFKNAKGIVSAGKKNKFGYHIVSVTKKGKQSNVKVHRLVAEHFLPNYSQELTVNHKDFDKSNNHCDNLEMISASENVMHFILNKKKLNSSSLVLGVGFHTGLNKWTARTKINNSRFNLGVFDTEAQAIKAIEDFKNGLSEVHIGKGKQNKGRSKYSESENIDALVMAEKIGVRKAGEITKMGSTRISKLRTEYKLICGTFVKNS